MMRFIAAFAVSLLAVGTGHAQAARSVVQRGQAQADNCSIAIVGDVNNSNVSVSCPIIQVLQEIRDISGSQKIDPLVLHLIRQGSFEEAVMRIDRLVADGVAKPSIYLSVAASLLMVQGSPQEGLDYARRAYESDRQDAMLVLRYYAALTANQRTAEAEALIAAAYRRRSEFTGVGRHLLDVAKLETDYPFEALEAWHEKIDSCPPAPAASARASACGLDAEAQRSVRTLRDRASRLEQSVAASEPIARTSMQTRHYLLQYVLIGDELLRDHGRAAKTEAMMNALAAEILKRFGPWALLLGLQSEVRLDLVTSPERLRQKYEMFDLALRAAPSSPIIALGADTADEEILPRQTGIMLASFRLARAAAAARVDDNAAAWRNVIASMKDAIPYGSSRLAVDLRLAALLLAVNVIGPDDSRFDRNVVLSEFRKLKSAFSQSPALWRTSGPMLEEVSSSLCEADILPDDDCSE